MSKTLDQIIAEADAAAAEIPKIKHAAAALTAASNQISESIERMELSVRFLAPKPLICRDQKLLAQLRQIEERLARLREFRNMMELGSFELHVNRVMETAWEILS